MQNVFKTKNVNIKQDYFTINICVLISENTFIFVPTVAEVLKYAWMQFLSIFVILYVAKYFLYDFVFTNQILITKISTIQAKTKTE